MLNRSNINAWAEKAKPLKGGDAKPRVYIPERRDMTAGLPKSMQFPLAAAFAGLPKATSGNRSKSGIGKEVQGKSLCNFFERDPNHEEE